MPQREQQKERLRGQESERKRIYALECRTSHKGKAFQLQQHKNIATNENFQPKGQKTEKKEKGIQIQYNTIQYIKNEKTPIKLQTQKLNVQPSIDEEKN